MDAIIGKHIRDLFNYRSKASATRPPQKKKLRSRRLLIEESLQVNPSTESGPSLGHKSAASSLRTFIYAYFTGLVIFAAFML